VKLPLRQMTNHRAQTMSGRRESTDQRHKNYSVLLKYLKDRGVATVPIDLKSLSSGNLVRPLLTTVATQLCSREVTGKTGSTD
jgi:hypothetical protein